MQRHAEGFETKFVCQAELLETEEILVEILGEITANKLFATVVESSDAVSTSVIAQSGTL